MSELLTPTDFAQALKRVLPPSRPVPLHEPSFRGNEWDYVKECIDTAWVSSVGSFVDRFEADLASFTGAAGAVAVVNGTAALHVCLQLCGVQPGDEVLVPTLTFIATANAIDYCGATPHFIDSERTSLGVDAARLDDWLREVAELRSDGCFNRTTGAPIRALLAVHVFGHPCDLDALAEVCNRWNLVLIEDAAESLGSTYKGQHTGTFGRMAALSFNGNKVVTTGGGGAVLTQDTELAAQAKHLTTTAKTPHRWEYVHDRVGFNYRLPNINAALGCAQLEQLPDMLSNKRALAQRYAEALTELPGVCLLGEPEATHSNHWLSTALLDVDSIEQRDRFLEAAHLEGVLCRPVWGLMHHQGMYSDCPRMELPVAQELECRLISLPSSEFL